MSKSSISVLQSLTATYTDSEGEDEERSDRKRRSSSLTSDGNMDVEKESTATNTATSIATPESNKSGTNTPQSGSSISAAEIRRVAARLVSYNNDEAMSDEDDGEEEDSNSRVEFPVIRSSRPVSPSAEPIKLLPGEELLPPEPTGKCPADLQEKITRQYESMLQRNISSLNFQIQQRKQFRNPSIYEKLIDHLDIEEIGTNYPPSIYDPYQWGEESYYENLSKVQREEMEKREKERRERTKVEFVSGTAPKKSGSSGGTDEEKKRKSKWDQTVPLSQGANLTSVATGTKMAIPAFGTLPKKAKQV
ncbi:SAP30-binding protein-like [Daphnia pulex]|uniref:SAP30-binding protein-like n=1 Tax=Daphnia pulex TaxID=6669 RepID=UPI001EE06BCC|nr:SAP30-binding protein-like [Daphnia pulex]XP_046638384.1 SAP30-binding protein-like [Daphnia pulicaria]